MTMAGEEGGTGCDARVRLDLVAPPLHRIVDPRDLLRRVAKVGHERGGDVPQRRVADPRARRRKGCARPALGLHGGGGTRREEIIGRRGRVESGERG